MRPFKPHRLLHPPVAGAFSCVLLLLQKSPRESPVAMLCGCICSAMSPAYYFPAFFTAFSAAIRPQVAHRPWPMPPMVLCPAMLAEPMISPAR